MLCTFESARTARLGRILDRANARAIATRDNLDHPRVATIQHRATDLAHAWQAAYATDLMTRKASHRKFRATSPDSV